MNWTQIFAAFFIAPALPGFVLAGAAIWMGTPISSAGSMLVLASIVTYAHAVVLGLPTAWLLYRYGPPTWVRVVVAAFLIGALPFACLTLYQESTISPGEGYEANGVVLRQDGHLTDAGMRSAILGVLQLGGVGAITGLLWWLIARPKTRRFTA